MTTPITKTELKQALGEFVTKEILREELQSFFTTNFLPLFETLVARQDAFDAKLDRVEYELSDFKAQQYGVNTQMIDFKSRQLTFNDWGAGKIENMENEYHAICHQLEEYDNFFHDSSIPEEKKKAAYKVMVIKIQNLERELNQVKKVLHMA